MKILHNIKIQCLLIFLLTVLTAQDVRAAWECNELTTKFCLIDKSSTYKAFCQSDTGQTYEGYQNCKGQRQGKGTYTWPSGQLYEGDFQSNQYHGQGIMIYRNDNKYIGSWRLDKRHGYGTFTWADGSRYEGQFKNDERHGSGTFYYSGKYKGDFSEREYVNGERVGTETYYGSDGRIIRYQIENGERGQRTVIKSSADVRKEKSEKRKREEKLAQQRQKEREAAEKQEKLREAKARQEKLEVDNCLLELYVDDGSWSENSARNLCRIAIKQSHNAVMANCILDKGYKKPVSVFDSVQNVCEQISINPGWLDQLKYSTPLSEYLTKLK